MKTVVRSLMITVTILLSARSWSQDMADVQLKAYGSYGGGQIDTIDYASGNVLLNIPLISFPQRGKLPPLTFSISLNNSPYSQSYLCDPDNAGTGYSSCVYTDGIYDTSPPGGYSPNYIQPDGQHVLNGKRGAYFTSNYEGGVASGVASGPAGEGVNTLSYSIIDESGGLHAMESDSTNSGILHAVDGTGYTFAPNGDPINPIDPTNWGCGSWEFTESQPYWLSPANPYYDYSITNCVVRTGTIYSPDGITYTNTFINEPALTNPHTSQRLVQTVVADPMGNTITRGPWYWGPTGQAPSSSLLSYYVDSVGRTISDIVTNQDNTLPASSRTCPPPGGGNGVDWIVPGPGGTTLTYTICYTEISGDPLGYDPIAQAAPTTWVPFEATGQAISAVILPNGTYWGFTYSSPVGSSYYAGPDITSIHFPTGGSILYSWGTLPPEYGYGGRCNGQCHAVQTRVADDGGGNIDVDTYTYAMLYPQNDWSYEGPFLYSTTDQDSVGKAAVHTFTEIGSNMTSAVNQLFETELDVYQGSASGTPLKTVSTQYQYVWDVPTGGGGASRVVNILPSSVTTSTPAGVSSYESRSYTPIFTASRLTCPAEPQGVAYSSAQCIASSAQIPTSSTNWSNTFSPYTPTINLVSPTTRIVTDPKSGAYSATQTAPLYSVNSAYLAANLLSLPAETVTGALPNTSLFGYPALSNATGEATYFIYDENNGSPQGILGNLTSSQQALAVGGLCCTHVTTSTVYNSQGMPTQHIDANGNTTITTYDGTGLFPSEVQRPVTNGVTHNDYFSYDANTGSLLSHVNENGSGPGDSAHKTSFTYDVMKRVTSVTYPDGGGSTFCYTDIGGTNCTSGPSPFSLYTTTLATPDPSIQTRQTFDGFGRVIQSVVLSDPLGATYTNTMYDGDGRVISVTNPFRAEPAAGDPPLGTTTFSYDALDRKITQIQADGSSQYWCYDGQCLSPYQEWATSTIANQSSVPSATWTDFFDETGRHTQQVTDALGRLAAVLEPHPSSGALALETDYTYDYWNNLLGVNQKGSSGATARSRLFSYDMLNRLTQACNPETLPQSTTCDGTHWSTLYSYDNDGNLLTKTDARGVTINYSPSGSPIDALNRVTMKTYSSGDPSVTYTYDTATNGIGKLATENTGNTITSHQISSYDVMGRVLDEWHWTTYGGGWLALNYTYDLAGKLTSYAGGGNSNLGFNNSYDAAGRLSTVQTLPHLTTTLFSASRYTPSGALSGALLGSSLHLSRTFDNRMRVVGETDSTSTAVGAVGGSVTLTVLGSEQHQ